MRALFGDNLQTERQIFIVAEVFSQTERQPSTSTGKFMLHINGFRGYETSVVLRGAASQFAKRPLRGSKSASQFAN